MHSLFVGPFWVTPENGDLTYSIFVLKEASYVD